MLDLLCNVLFCQCRSCAVLKGINPRVTLLCTYTVGPKTFKELIIMSGFPWATSFGCC